MVFNIMNGLGLVYYAFFDGYYKQPVPLALFYGLLTAITVNLGYIAYNKWFSSVDLGLGKLNLAESNSMTGIERILGFAIFFGPALIYFGLFIDFFPILKALGGEAIGEASRLDVSGGPPLYYTFSVWVASFVIPFAFSTFYSSWNKMGWFALILIFALLLGNKALFFQIFFFLLFIGGKATYNISKMLLFGVIAVIAYAAIKIIFYQSLPYENFLELFESLFRRVSIINASLFGTYQEHFIIKEEGVPSDFTHIKQFLFYRIYGHVNGGAPVFYAGSMLDIIGFGVFQVLFSGVMLMMIFLIRNVFRKLFNNKFKETLKYLDFVGAVVLANSFFSDFLIRYFIPVVFFILLGQLASKVNFYFISPKRTAQKLDS